MKPDDVDDLLQRLVTGDLNMDDEEARNAFDAQPSLRERFEEVRATADFLDAAGEFHEQLASEVDGTEESGDEAAVDQFVQERLQPKTSSRVWLLAAAAALVAVLFAGMRFLAETPPVRPTDQMLGAGIGSMDPTGPVEQFGTFRWDDAAGIPPAGWYVVFVRSSSGSELARSGKLRTPRWAPEADQRESWPTSIVWEVRAYDATGASTHSGETGASLSAR